MHKNITVKDVWHMFSLCELWSTPSLVVQQCISVSKEHRFIFNAWLHCPTNSFVSLGSGDKLLWDKKWRYPPVWREPEHQWVTRGSGVLKELHLQLRSMNLQHGCLYLADHCLVRQLPEFVMGSQDLPGGWCNNCQSCSDIWLALT